MAAPPRAPLAALAQAKPAAAGGGKTIEGASRARRRWIAALARRARRPLTRPSPPRHRPRARAETYQKKTQLEHILLRPDTYVGSVARVTQPMWVLDGAGAGARLVLRPTTFVPGLYKVFDEILVNAADNRARQGSGMNALDVTIDAAAGVLSVRNNGKGIPVALHKEHGVYVPELIFGHLLTSSNYDDDEKKVTGAA